MHQYNAKVGGDEFSSAAHSDVVPLTNVIDMDGDRRVRADAVFLHQRDQL